MDPKEIKKFLELIEDTDIVELNWEKEGQKIGFRKKEVSVRNVAREEQPVQESAPVAAADGKTPVADPAVDQNYHTIKSSMVGTFFTAPTPDSPPYIQEGSKVKKGQKIAVIEAMKIMKEVVADIDGKIIKILVENAHHVEYGHPIFIIAPNAEA
jgi:acetyl-CoA carboxylase biotin carboxyl carrier protein